MALRRRPTEPPTPLELTPFAAVGLEKVERRRKPRRPSPRKQFDRALQDAQRRLALWRGGDRLAFEVAHPECLVGMYVLLHRGVYGVAPDELLAGDAMRGAVSAAGKLVREVFAGDVLQAVEFIRWTWAREAGAEKRRAAAGSQNGFRIGWRLQFCHRTLVTDWRVSQHREARRG